MRMMMTTTSRTTTMTIVTTLMTTMIVIVYLRVTLRTKKWDYLERLKCKGQIPMMRGPVDLLDSPSPLSTYPLYFTKHRSSVQLHLFSILPLLFLSIFFSTEGPMSLPRATLSLGSYDPCLLCHRGIRYCSRLSDKRLSLAITIIRLFEPSYSSAGLFIIKKHTLQMWKHNSYCDTDMRVGVRLFPLQCEAC